MQHQQIGECVCVGGEGVFLRVTNPISTNTVKHVVSHVSPAGPHVVRLWWRFICDLNMYVHFIPCIYAEVPFCSL